MEQKKFRLRLNIFDGIVLLAALAVGAFLLWNAMKPEVPQETVPTNNSTVRFTVRVMHWSEGTSALIQKGDQIADNIKNYVLGEVVDVQAVPCRQRVPDRESLRSFAAHQATMVLFLSAGLADKVREDLLAGGYPPETPAAVVYKATWPDEMILRCTVDTLPETIGAGNIKKTALIIVGDCMGDKYLRSRLYSPDFSTEFRKGTDDAEET